MIEGPRGAWITVQEAMRITNRGKTTIYRWMERNLVRVSHGPDGVQRVWGADVLAAESSMKRGRPRK